MFTVPSPLPRQKTTFRKSGGGGLLQTKHAHTFGRPVYIVLQKEEVTPLSGQTGLFPESGGASGMEY